MLGFNHVLAGSIVAIIVPAPLVPFVALGSHFLLDLSPHFGFPVGASPYAKPYRYVLYADGVLCIASLALALTLFPSQWFIICVGAFFGILPDFLWPLWHKGPKLLDKFLDFAEYIQWGERTYGAIFDTFYGMIMIITLYLLSGHN